MAMLPACWQFPLPGLPTALDVPTRVGHGVRQVFHAPVTHEEWLMYHDRSCLVYRVTGEVQVHPSKSLHGGVWAFASWFGRPPLLS